MAASRHPYASGNYRPVSIERDLEVASCEGSLPEELAGGSVKAILCSDVPLLTLGSVCRMYVRNGSNPAVPTSSDGSRSDRPYHWVRGMTGFISVLLTHSSIQFDGDGMLQGVYFSRQKGSSDIQPLFVNKAVLTDVLLALPSGSKSPILPSISTLLGPVTQLPSVVFAISRAVALSALSFVSTTKQAVERLSVANTSVLFHDGRALAGCESGPLAWVRLPSLETVGWWDLEQEGQIGLRQKAGVLGWMKEWTTAHVSCEQRPVNVSLTPLCSPNVIQSRKNWFYSTPQCSHRI